MLHDLVVTVKEQNKTIADLHVQGACASADIGTNEQSHNLFRIRLRGNQSSITSVPSLTVLYLPLLQVTEAKGIASNRAVPKKVETSHPPDPKFDALDLKVSQSWLGAYFDHGVHSQER